MGMSHPCPAQVLALAMRPLVDAPIASKNKFHKFRATGGLPFDAVPVLFDVDAGDALDVDAVCRRLEAGDAVAESAAICQHLARRFHLDGADEAERTAAGAVASAVAAARGALVTARFGDDPDKALVAFALGPLKRLLARLERLLGRRARPAFVAGGPTPTYADAVVLGAAKESEIPNFKGSHLGHFPLVLADFWTSDHLSERSRSMDAVFGTRARGTLTLKRR